MKLKIAVLIPDRGDRPELMANCLRMLKAQTVQPDHIEVVNDAPVNDKCDITYRYRTGYDRLRNKRFDIILLWENDDWYATTYIEFMIGKWLEAGKPDIFGTTYTVYYHLRLHKWFKISHSYCSSAMSTLIKPDMNFPWCQDHDPYTDMHLWKNIKGMRITPLKEICIGMKHNTGKCGGRNHNNYLHQFTNANGLMFLQQYLDRESYFFYSTFYERYEMNVLTKAV